MSYPLAIYDYGIGGVDLLKRLKSVSPDLPTLYFSDSGAIPYGKLSKLQLRKRVNNVLAFLFQHGAKHVVIACHSASSVVESRDTRITTITDATVKAALQKNFGEIGVIGGGRTVRSGIYRQALQAEGLLVKQRNAQILSILIERGEVSTEAVKEEVRKILNPLQSVDAVLLACTHYAALADLLRSEINCKEVIDPVLEIVEELRTLILDKPPGSQPDLYLTTGDISLMKNASKAAFNWPIASVQKVGMDLSMIA